MYKAILIDDEPLARQLVKAFLKPYELIEVVAECGDGFEGFKAIQQHNPDLIFLDVQMPRVSGFEMLELLDQPPSVIFTTAFDEYALKAFEAQAVDYLLKPITKERFDKAVKKWLADTEKAVPEGVGEILRQKVYEGYQHRLVVKDNGMIRIIPAEEIFFVEASDDYVKIHTKAGNFLKKSTLGQIETSLDPGQFVRVHRSYLVAVNQLLRLEPYEKDSHIAVLACGMKVNVSKSGMARLKTILNW